MKSDLIIRALREQPDLFASLQSVIAEQREKVVTRIPSADTERDLFRLQGELRALTNLVAHFKTLLGNQNHARANGRPEASN